MGFLKNIYNIFKITCFCYILLIPIFLILIFFFLILITFKVNGFEKYDQLKSTYNNFISGVDDIIQKYNTQSRSIPYIKELINTSVDVINSILGFVLGPSCTPNPPKNIFIDCPIEKIFANLSDDIERIIQSFITVIKNINDVFIETFSFFVCDVNLMSSLNIKTPPECPRLDSGNIIVFLFNLVKHIYDVINNYINFFLIVTLPGITGEYGFTKITAGAAPYYSTKNYGPIRNIFEAIVRVYEFKQIFYNHVIGFFFNVIYSPIDFFFCSLNANFGPCIARPACLLVLDKIFCDVIKGNCICSRFENVLITNFKVPCRIHPSFTCSRSETTICSNFWFFRTIGTLRGSEPCRYLENVRFVK